MILSRSFYIALYLKLTPKEKKIVQQIYHNQKTNTISFLKGKSLCKKAGCGRDTRKRLKRKNKGLNSLMFDCNPRFDKNGRQTTDQYVLNNNFKMALQWIEISYGLNAKKNKHAKIISHMENDEKCAPPPLQNAPPLVKINLKKERFKRTPQTPLKKEYINPIVEKIKIPEKDKKLLSCYPEFAIAKTIEDVIWYRMKGYKIQDPVGFMISRINDHLKKERKNAMV